MIIWLDDVTYVKNINGRLHLIRVRPESKSPSKDTSLSINYTASHSQSRSNSSAQRASVKEVKEKEFVEKVKFYELKENFDKLAELFKSTSTRRTQQNQPFVFNKEKQDMAGHDSKEAAKDDASDKSTSTENVTGNVPPACSTLPPGFQAKPGIYTVGGRTLALVPTPPTINAGFVGPNSYARPGFGQQYMYGGGSGPMMGGMMTQPQMGMGFGGFNSQYDKPPPAQVAQVDLATSITVTRYVCAGCGNLRSRKFQAENPLEPGEQPPISYCRKCEKEIKSTDDEDDGKEDLSKKKKSLKASYVKGPEPFVVIEPIIAKGKHNHTHKKDKKEEKQEARPVVAPADKASLHTCAQCGNTRSRKFQARHPIRKGETPRPGFCGKCQKEETSSEDSDKNEDEEKSTISHEGRFMDNRQYVSVPIVDERYADRVITTRQKLRAPPPIEVVEEYASSYDSAKKMPPPRRPHHKHKQKSSSQKVTTRTPAPIAVGNYLSNLIFGKKKYESVGEDLMVEHRRREHREQSQDRSRGRSRTGPQSQSHHHRHRRSVYEVPAPSALIDETFVTETVPVRRRARSLDRGEGPQKSRSRSESRSKQQPEAKRRYNDRGDYESYESDGDTEDIARKMYKAYLSDGAPMHEEHRHYQRQHHHENVQHYAGPDMSHSESFDSNRVSEASVNRHRERSASRPHQHHENAQHNAGSRMSHSGSYDSSRFSEAAANCRGERSASRPREYTPSPIAQEPQQPGPILQRPPDEVIVTTERYVFKKPDFPNSSRVASTHSESTLRDGRAERASDISSRRSQKYLTHDDKAEHYPEEWSIRYDRGQRRESASLPQNVVSEEVHRERRQRRHFEPHRDDSSSVHASPGSFIDAESIRSQDSNYSGLSNRTANPPRMLRHKANTNTESISTDRTSDYTTSSGSHSSIYTTTSQRERDHYASRRGDATPRDYDRPQVSGSYISESQSTTSSVRRHRERSEMDRPRGRDRRRSPSPIARGRYLTPANYPQPSVSDASDDDTSSDHATAGVKRVRLNSRDRGRKDEAFDGNDPSELTSNDRIRSRDISRRARRVSFGGGPDELHTYSQVSVPTELGTTTDQVLRDIERARELEHRREDERRREDDRRREEERREDERRERRRRERAAEREELKRISQRDRERQKELGYGYVGGRG